MSIHRARTTECALSALLLALLLAGAGTTHGSGVIERPWERWWFSERDALRSPRTILPAEERAEVVDAIAALLESETPIGRDLQRASMLLLAKATATGTHTHLLRRVGRVNRRGRRQARVPDITEETALLGLGLLRRSDPDLRFHGALLDALRKQLFLALEDRDRASRTRAFAAFALGLLGDQPSGPEGHADVGRTLTTARLFHQLGDNVPLPGSLPVDQDVGVALLVAIALQPPSSVHEAQRDLLRHLAWGEGFGGRAAPDPVAAWATSALARYGCAEDLGQLAGLLARKGRVAPVRRRAAAIALGHLGSRLPEEDRSAFRVALERGLEGEDDGRARHLARVALARLGRVHPETRKAFEDGEPIDRASAAVALALVRRSRNERGWEALAAHLGDRQLDREAQAGLSIAAGIAREEACRDAVLTIFEDARRFGGLRSHAAEAIGLYGEASEQETQTLLGVLGETPFGTASPVARVLGPAATDLLIARLREETTTSSRSIAALALGETGDARAIPPLLAVVRDEERTDLERAIACTALGALVDPEPRPSTSLLKRDFDMGAGTGALHEVWSID